jgi:2-keto-3-deoxy-L-rhamnonate aldolase RhmA
MQGNIAQLQIHDQLFDQLHGKLDCVSAGDAITSLAGRQNYSVPAFGQYSLFDKTVDAPSYRFKRQVNRPRHCRAADAAANSGVDFVWTEMKQSAGTWDSVQKMWSRCPNAKAVPGMRIPNANEFDEQHALDLGAMVLIVPTVHSVAEAREAVKWAYYPPKGGRSQGNMSAAYSKVPGAYHNTFNNNLVLIAMIETLDGLRDANKIAALPGIDAVFAASGDLSNFTGYKQGDPDYERAINIVHNAALRAGKYLCGPWFWQNRPDFKCFQGHGGDKLATPAPVFRPPLWRRKNGNSVHFGISRAASREDPSHSVRHHGGNNY